MMLGLRRAPPSILNVHPGQPVELRITKRSNEHYVPPKHVRTFQGSGHRLGAPVPSVSAEASSSMPGTFLDSSSASASSSGSGERPNITTKFEVDQSQATTSVQIRLADGTRSGLPVIIFNLQLIVLLKDGMQDEPHPHNSGHSELH